MFTILEDCQKNIQITFWRHECVTYICHKKITSIVNTLLYYYDFYWKICLERGESFYFIFFLHIFYFFEYETLKNYNSISMNTSINV
jgi:hypothetical protein